MSNKPPHLLQYRQFGPWECLGWLGGGANGDVYEARPHGSDYPNATAAIKIFRQDRGRIKAMHKFEREIAFLTRHADYPGILPVVDVHLHEPVDSLLWYVMPYATPFVKEPSLADNAYEITKAYKAVARTLADLALQDVHHRSIKPTNLFFMDGMPLVGDFGMLLFEDTIDLTKRQKPAKGIDFVSPEMHRNLETKDAEKSDVFALAQSLRASLAGLSDIDAALSDAMNELDDLITESLNPNAGERPVMAKFAGEMARIFDEIDDASAQETGPKLDAASSRLGKVLAVGAPNVKRKAELAIHAQDAYDSLMKATIGVALESLTSLAGLTVHEFDIPQDQVALPHRRALALCQGASRVTAAVAGAELSVTVHAGFWDQLQSELLKGSVERAWGEAEISLRIHWTESDIETDVWTYAWQETLRFEDLAKSLKELSHQTSKQLANAYDLLANWVERRELPAG